MITRFAAACQDDASPLEVPLAGGCGILKDLPLERWHRDALAGPVMPLANDGCLEPVGKILSGLEAATPEFQ